MYKPPIVWAPYTLSLFTTIISALLCVISLTGNALVCLAIFKDPLGKLRSPFAYFLVNLTCSDLVAGGVMLPISVITHALEMAKYVPKVLIVCIQYTYFASANASILSLLALTVDRYFAVVSAIRYRVYFSKKRCVVVSFVIWILSLSLPLVELRLSYIDSMMFFSHTAVFVELIGITVTYVRQKLFLRQQRASMNKIQNTSFEAARKSEERKLRTENKLTKAFLFILLLFAITYIPAVIVIYVLQFCEYCSDVVVHILRDTQFIIISCNSCMNSFVCCLKLKYYRKSIRALFSKTFQTFCCHTRPNTVNRDRRPSTIPRTSTVTSDIPNVLTNGANNDLKFGNASSKVKETRGGGREVLTAESTITIGNPTITVKDL